MRVRSTRTLLTSVLLAGALIAASCGSDSNNGGASEPSDTGPVADTVPVVGTGPDETVAAPADTNGSGTMASAITEPVTIRFENYNLASAGAGRDATLALLDEFEASHPLITVETTATGSQEIFQSIQAQVVAGNPPDIAQLILREWDQIIENLPVKPLDDIVGADVVTNWLESSYPYHPKAAELTVRNGVQYGLAYVFSTPTLFYNADLFTEAGLDPDNPPTSWADVATAAQAISDSTDAGGIYIDCIELDWCTQGIIRSNGGRVMSEDRSEITWASPEAIEVYESWQAMTESGSHVDMSATDARDAFSAGTLGMILDTSAYQTSFLTASEGNWELRSTGMPSFGDKPVIPVNSGSGLGILTDDPLKQQAAWELMQFLTSNEAQTTITKDMGYLPLRPGLVDDDAYLGKWEHRDLILPNLAQLDNLEPSLSFPGQNALQIRDLFLNSLENVLFNGGDAASVFTESQQQANKLVTP